MPHNIHRLEEAIQDARAYAGRTSRSVYIRPHDFRPGDLSLWTAPSREDIARVSPAGDVTRWPERIRENTENTPEHA